MDKYTAKIIEYINNPQYQGIIEEFTHKLTLKSPECGDYNDIYVRLVDERIEDISYENSGCSLNIAALEIFCSKIKGEELSILNKLGEKQIKEKLDFPSFKTHCIELALETLRQLQNKKNL